MHKRYLLDIKLLKDPYAEVFLKEVRRHQLWLEERYLRKYDGINRHYIEKYTRNPYRWWNSSHFSGVKSTTERVESSFSRTLANWNTIFNKKADLQINIDFGGFFYVIIKTRMQ
jgi:hypothetical protein